MDIYIYVPGLFLIKTRNVLTNISSACIALITDVYLLNKRYLRPDI